MSIIYYLLFKSLGQYKIKKLNLNFNMVLSLTRSFDIRGIRCRIFFEKMIRYQM